LKKDEVLIIMDFSGRFLVKGDIQLSQEDFFARYGVPCLVMFCYYLNEKGEVIHQVSDFMSKTEEKDDFDYVRARIYLLEHPFMQRFKKIVLYSDGGPKHFKIRKTLFSFSVLDHYFPQSIEYNFFSILPRQGVL